jgi:hypothetical protein
MRTEKIIWGLIFIFIGTVFMLDNFDVIHFYWGSVWRFWPVIFILIGANMLISRFTNRTMAPLLTALITVSVLVFIGYQGVKPHSGRSWLNVEFDSDRRSRSNVVKNDVSSFSEPYSGLKYARLDVKGGATIYELSDSTSNLFEADVREFYGSYLLERRESDSTEVLVFRKRDKENRRFRLNDIESNETRMRLSSLPVWDINVEMGAGATELDLEHFKVRNLSFKGGAASFEAKIGSLEPLSTIKVETGVASVEIEIPASSGSRITLDSGLSSKDFEGFIKQADGSYKTSNYDTAVNKVNISLKGGLSSFEVKRY